MGFSYLRIVKIMTYRVTNVRLGKVSLAGGIKLRRGESALVNIGDLSDSRIQRQIRTGKIKVSVVPAIAPPSVLEPKPITAPLPVLEPKPITAPPPVPPPTEDEETEPPQEVLPPIVEDSAEVKVETPKRKPNIKSKRGRKKKEE